MKNSLNFSFYNGFRIHVRSGLKTIDLIQHFLFEHKFSFFKFVTLAITINFNRKMILFGP